MKELSIEEKAKRYDEAFERMKSWVKGEHPECFSEAQKAAEFIFPELKESEDERIRKKVIDVLKLNVRGAESQMQASRGVDRTFEVYACNKVISWLEKQGDKKPAWSKEDERVQCMCFEAIDNASDCYEVEDLRTMKNWLENIEHRVLPQPK